MFRTSVTAPLSILQWAMSYRIVAFLKGINNFLDLGIVTVEVHALQVGGKIVTSGPDLGRPGTAFDVATPDLFARFTDAMNSASVSDEIIGGAEGRRLGRVTPVTKMLFNFQAFLRGALSGSWRRGARGVGRHVSSDARVRPGTLPGGGMLMDRRGRGHDVIMKRGCVNWIPRIIVGDRKE